MKTPVDYSRITPEYLSQYVNFFYKEENWQYQPTSEHPSMQNVQAEGATAIWNRLLDDHIVLLADEVGMGKTIQALAVMATLWRQNPHARVLVYAPRESVAINWINEYNSFIYNHYRVHDDLVKMAMGEFPARKPFYCHNHGQLLNTFYYHNPQFSVGKTSSLSNLRNIENQIDPELLNQGFPERNWHDSKGEVNKFSQIGADSRNFLKNYFGTGNQPPIDLLIIDEAHYYRNLNGGSQKVQAAQGFFGTGGSPKLADKVLLMTATPNHSGKHNVKNLFSYFQDTDKQSANNLLENHCIRRLRRLSAKGHTKYNYRKENPEPSQFQDLKESLFFGLYHKALHKKMEENENNKHATNLMFGYLEGFEFTDPKQTMIEQHNEGQEKEHDDSIDFRVAPDSEIIQKIGHQYRSTFSNPPPHPKYEKVVEQLTPEKNGDSSNEEGLIKQVVYVRRIASTKEISQRMTQKYDEWMWKKMKTGLQITGEQINIPKNRDRFNELYKNREDETSEENEEGGEDEFDDHVPNSKILHLFKKIQNGTHTACENFRLKFEKPVGPFYLFFLPPSDHKYQPYELAFLDQTKAERKDDKFNYKLATAIERQEKTGKSHVFQELYGNIGLAANRPELQKEANRKDFYPTLLSIFLESASKTEADTLFRKAYEEYQNWDEYEKEGFSDYLKKGILQASTFVVDLFIWFENLRANDYREFCEKVKEKLPKIGLDQFLANLILHFRHTYQKHLAINNSRDLISENWGFLEKVNPAYPYSGDTKRAPIIKAFNTLFFPNVLVATSVLQEGVNLQNHCDSVIHYGIAWTPGDNEQRVGRVDRMYSRIERKLENGNGAQLDISYPYLVNTLDEDQLRNFSQKKLKEEELIDKLEETDSDKEIKAAQGIEEENWHEKFFRQPLTYESNDPYKPSFQDLASNDCLPEVTGLVSNLNKKVETSIYHLTYNEPVEWMKANALNFPQISQNVCLINQVDSQLMDGREQPVTIEAQYMPEITTQLGSPAYCLMLKTPLGRKNPLDVLKTHKELFDYYQAHPFIKLAAEESKKKSSQLFDYYLRVDLPYHSSKNFETLSQAEIRTALENLIVLADRIEQEVYNWGQDIKNRELTYSDAIQTQVDAKLRRSVKTDSILSNWQYSANGDCLYRQIHVDSPINESTLRFNHEHPLVRMESFSESTVFTQAYWEVDFQEKERQIFKECLAWVI